MAPSVALVALTASSSLLLVGAIAFTLYLHRERIQDVLEEYQLQAQVRRQHWMRERSLSMDDDRHRDDTFPDKDAFDPEQQSSGVLQKTSLDDGLAYGDQSGGLMQRQGFKQEEEAQAPLLSRASSFAIVSDGDSQPSDFTDSDDETFRHS